MPLYYQHDVKISCTISCIITYQHDITISCMYVAFVVRDASPRQTSLPLVWSLVSQRDILHILVFILFFVVLHDKKGSSMSQLNVLLILVFILFFIIKDPWQTRIFLLCCHLSQLKIYLLSSILIPCPSSPDPHFHNFLRYLGQAVMILTG